MKWEKCSFVPVSGTLVKESQACTLPFTIGAVTKHGREHERRGIPNQDAVHLVVKPTYIVGILSDGCTSNHSAIVQSRSNNQTGSSLLAHIVGYVC